MDFWSFTCCPEEGCFAPPFNLQDEVPQVNLAGVVGWWSWDKKKQGKQNESKDQVRNATQCRKKAAWNFGKAGVLLWMAHIAQDKAAE